MVADDTVITMSMYLFIIAAFDALLFCCLLSDILVFAVFMGVLCVNIVICDKGMSGKQFRLMRFRADLCVQCAIASAVPNSFFPLPLFGGPYRPQIFVEVEGNNTKNCLYLSRETTQKLPLSLIGRDAGSRFV